MKTKLTILILWLGLTHIAAAQTATETYGQLSVSGKYIVDKNENPVQLRGMSLYWSQWQGKYYTYNTVKWLRDDWKCTIVRAAMGVSASVNGYTKNGTVAKTEKMKVKTVVDAAIDLGIYVIIDWHTHEGLSAGERAAAIDFFSEMAETYKGHPNVIYEIFNEPLKVSWSDLKIYSEEVIAAIREHDKDNIIVCGTPNWSQDVDAVIAAPITAYQNIAYTLHYYAATHKQKLRDKALNAINNGLCLFVTEFGTCDASGDTPIDAESSALWFEFLDEHKLSWCNWSMADVKEAASVVTPGASTAGGWSSDQITVSGNIVRDELLYHYYASIINSGDKPIFSSQPASAIVGLGQSHQLTGDGISLSNISYQWYLNGQEIDGATSTILQISDFSEASAGAYYLKMTNPNGSSSSDTATLTLVIRRPYKGIIVLPGTLELEDYDQGENGYTYFDTDPANQGGKYRTTEGVDIEVSEDGGFQVGYTAQGEWLEYTVNVAEDGDYSLIAYVASTQAGGRFEASFGNYATATFTVPNTGSWTKRTSVKAKISLKAGEQIVRVKILNSISFNMDKIVAEPYTEDPESPVYTSSATSAGALNIFPNPAQDLVSVSVSEPGILTVSQMTSAISSFPIEGTQTYSLSGLAPGVYLFNLQTESGIASRLIVKQ